MEESIYEYSPILEPRSSRPPALIYDYSIDLDGENSIFYVPDVLPEDELNRYIEEAIEVPRVRGKSAFGQDKPRIEVAYTIDGTPFKYSRQEHYTTTYPEHVMRILPILLDEVNEELGEPTDWELSTGIDIVYPASFIGSGSIGAHADDEALMTHGRHWDLILIYSLGQTRYLRVRRKDRQGPYINVPLPNNSLVAMYGPTFQELYTHQIDRLKANEPQYDRHSINVRYFSK